MLSTGITHGARKERGEKINGFVLFFFNSDGFQRNRMDDTHGSNNFSMQLANEMNNSCLSEWNQHGHSFQFLTNSSRLCTEDNVDEYIVYLNKVFRNMCLSSWAEEEQNQIVSLVNACSELIDRYQQDGRIREDLESRTRRTMSDYDQLQTAQFRLKDDVERLERDIALRQEKEKDLASKNRNLCSALKSEKDEVKRLQSVINHRESQYKHETKKKERETNRLKEKLNQVLMDKSQKLMGNEAINILPKTDSKRGTWKTTSKPEELYKLMLRNYEEKQKEMYQENLDLRNCLALIQHRLHSIVESYKSQFQFKKTESAESSCDDESSSFEEDVMQDEKFEQLVSNGSMSTIDYLPFEMNKEIIMKNFNKSCHGLVQLLKRGLHESEVSMAPLSPPVVPHVSEGDLEMQLSKLQKQVEECHEIIQLQDQVLRNAVGSMPESQPGHSFLHESHLISEYEELEAKKRLFMEEKENFNKERSVFTNAAIRLAEEKRSFHDEKFQQLKQQILDLTPQRAKLGSSNKSSPLTKEYGNRLLPVTPPTFQQSADQTPNKSEIYKTIDFCQNHFQNRNRSLQDSIQASSPISSNPHQYTRSQSYHESFQQCSVPSTPIEEDCHQYRHLQHSLLYKTSPSCRRQSAPSKSTSNSLICTNGSLRRHTNFASLTSLNDKIYLASECLPRVRSQSVDDHQRSPHN